MVAGLGLMRAGELIPGLAVVAAVLLLFAPAALAGPLDGKKYIIQMSSSQMASGYANYLVPPLAKVFDDAGFEAMRGPGADIVVNITTNSDVGQWVQTAKGKEWLYTVTITVGISPESYDIPYEGTPKFGVAASLVTPNGDREDELACLIGLAARSAIEKYKPAGSEKISGQPCLRHQ
jgi:hypothetical protein